MNFATLQGLTIPEGVVTQITDASGRVLWMAGGKPVVLEVSKKTANTYAGGTVYYFEKFILLDIYPTTNGTVEVTYGGLTKTITDTSGAEEPNAQQVFFGTFNGVSDSITTPDSGTLEIKGDYYAFGMGSYKPSSSTTHHCGCVSAVTSLGKTTHIANNMFYLCDSLTDIPLPEGAPSIGNGAFRNCTSLASIIIPESVTSIGQSAFTNCESLTTIIIPENVTKIGRYAFGGCYGLTSVKFMNTSGWKKGGTSVSIDVTDDTNNVKLLTSTYYSSEWERT